MKDQCMVGGYICKKLKLEVKQNQSEWVALKGEGRLLEPSDEVMEVVDKADQVFAQFHSNHISLRKTFDPVGKVIRLIMKKYPNFDARIVKPYCRVKFFARLKLMKKAIHANKGRCVRYMKQSAQFLY